MSGALFALSGMATLALWLATPPGRTGRGLLWLAGCALLAAAGAAG